MFFATYELGYTPAAEPKKMIRKREMHKLILDTLLFTKGYLHINETKMMFGATKKSMNV
jgi:hypothetical protein|tara:strand:+ start:1376 stop:1552 length:177 start_codon:yes stop_codon:yes gene_type:complete